ncbi:MAG: thioredoxin [Ginsengibacter sp.]
MKEIDHRPLTTANRHFRVGRRSPGSQTGTIYDGNLSMETFGDLINNKQPVLVDFHATWCGPCKMMAPELQRFAQNNSGKLRVIKIDIDRNQKAAQQYNIQGVPTLILFKEGKILWRQSGAMSAQQISDGVKSHL